jgi:sugar (pentulose or hexulose) kinase
MSDPAILAFDVGTSGVKAVVTRGRRIVSSAVRGYPLRTGEGGWVEQDLGEIRRAMGAASKAALRAADLPPPAGVDVIGITAQMFNLVASDDAGEPALPMLSWLDTRAATRARRLTDEVPESEQFELFGSVVTAKDVLPKILWLRDERPEVYRRTRWLLDCKEALVLQLTGRAVTDRTGSSVFRLTEPVTSDWSPDALRRVGVERHLLPEVCPASSLAGPVLPGPARQLGVRAGTPVIVGAGDVPASQLGAGAVDPGVAHLSLGTAVYLGATVGRPLADPGRKLGVLGHALDDRWILWLEIATGGGALAWLLRAMSPEGRRRFDYTEIDRMAEACADEQDGLLFAPWLSGERVPVFDDELRGAFVGLRLGHGRAHLIRAVMEGIACQIRWAFDYGEAYGEPIREVRAVGGGAIGQTWLQIIADVLGREIDSVAAPQDAGARGVAALALAALGAETDLQFVRDDAVIERTLRPRAGRREASERLYERYRRLHDALRPIFHAEPAEPIQSAGGLQERPPADAVETPTGFGAVA